MVGYGNDYKVRTCACIRPALLLKCLQSIIHFIAPVVEFISITNTGRCLK